MQAVFWVVGTRTICEVPAWVRLKLQWRKKFAILNSSRAMQM